MTRLDDVCGELTRCVPTAWALAQPDEDGTRTHAQPGSRPPWNAATANVATDIHETVRRLEASVRLAVTGHPGPRRGGSLANTGMAIRAIASLGHALDDDDAQRAATRLDRLVTAARQLPPVDEIPRWERIRPGDDGLPPVCPFCHTYSLRVAVASLAVACWYPACTDTAGNRPPMARMERGGASGQPMVVFRDGTVMTA